MSEVKPALAKRRVAWDGALEAIGAEHGFFERLDDRHKALYVRGDPETLVVTFDNLDDARQQVEDRLPWGVKFIREQGWSALGLAAHGFTWYRSDPVLDFFDRMRDDGFFAGFSNVVFYGTSMAGYAACAFASAAPGATVIALSPQATLDRAVTIGWEDRFREAWRRDFTGRYGYAPDHARSARKVWLFHDPLVRGDAMHAALFRGENIQPIACRHFGHNLGSVLNMMGALKPITRGIVERSITPQGVFAETRKRRELPYFQKHMLSQLNLRRHPRIAYDYCYAVLARSYPQGRPRFRDQMNRAADQLGLPHYKRP